MNKQPHPTPTAEAEAFTELTKRLLSVPKKEVDEQKAKYEKQKAREKQKRTK